MQYILNILWAFLFLSLGSYSYSNTDLPEGTLVKSGTCKSIEPPPQKTITCQKGGVTFRLWITKKFSHRDIDNNGKIGPGGFKQHSSDSKIPGKGAFCYEEGAFSKECFFYQQKTDNDKAHSKKLIMSDKFEHKREVCFGLLSVHKKTNSYRLLKCHKALNAKQEKLKKQGFACSTDVHYDGIYNDRQNPPDFTPPGRSTGRR